MHKKRWSAVVVGAFVIMAARDGRCSTERGFGFALENGDANGDWQRDISDAVHLLGHLFLGSPPPVPLATARCGNGNAAIVNGDVNGDDSIDISDATALLDWLFATRSEPDDGCGIGDGVAAERNVNPRVIPPMARPFGRSLGEWGAAWWQWAVATPAAGNPVLDETGEFCDANQSGPVWFLAGTFGGTVERACTVQAGTALFFPILNAFCSAEGTEEEMRACARGFVDQMSALEASVDGVALHDLDQYRADTPNFTLVLPEGDVFGAGPGEFAPSVADGFWIMLAPLPPGEHTIRFRGETGGGPEIGGFATESIYTLTVAP